MARCRMCTKKATQRVLETPTCEGHYMVIEETAKALLEAVDFKPLCRALSLPGSVLIKYTAAIEVV